ncbi:MAG: GspH/FimT family pseudopilin [Thiothrix sp.]|nr:GspH/FimT family pseudopilin [Thiothrix sp.]HPQ94000.1 GspH/FimT family pseudopilin [Thiolinea sp.]
MYLSRQAGLTLVELLVTVAVAAVIASMAMPGLQAMIENNRVRTVTNSFVSSLYLARSEAAKRRYLVVVCASDAFGTACDTSADGYTNGWLVFTDYNDNKQLDAPGNLLGDLDDDGVNETPEAILQVVEGIKGDLILTANQAGSRRSISFRPSGRANAITTFEVRRVSTDTALSKISISKTGRAKTCFGAACN